MSICKKKSITKSLGKNYTFYGQWLPLVLEEINVLISLTSASAAARQKWAYSETW